MSGAPHRESFDLVVVGGGVIGLACAWRAVQSGLSTLVLEREAEGAGASGVAAGMLAPVTEAEFGEEELLRLNLEAARRWPAFDAELRERSGLPTHYALSGALVAAADRDDAAELRRLHAFQRELGLEAEWLGGRECRQLEPGLSPRVPGGILAPHEAHVDPAATVRALAAALERDGGTLVRGEGVARVELEGDRVVGVTTTRGRGVGAASVLIAAGSWSGELEGVPAGLAPPVRPVKGQILSLRVRPGGQRLAQRLVRTPRCYVVSRADGRVAIGATVEERGFDTAITADGVYRLLEAAWEVLPEVAELEFVAARAGLRPGSPDNAPIVGAAGPEGLLVATGHYRNGVLLAPVTAEAIVALAAGEDAPEQMRAFAPDRFAARERALGGAL
ncbi:MAG: glycine oxidase ThiO [Thermoleophilaceae bacterium]|nr:glycine oxidase ThiO [Thermoleophilaceae bacterium]